MTRYLPTPTIDAVYVPLPNNLHAAVGDPGRRGRQARPVREAARRQRGQARAMFEAAEKHGVYLVEAYPYRAQPQTLKVRELARGRRHRPHAAHPGVVRISS